VASNFHVEFYVKPELHFADVIVTMRGDAVFALPLSRVARGSAG